MNANLSIAPNRDAERLVGSALILGGATSSAFAAKSFIAAGFAVHLIPLIGAIVGVALMILGSCLFYFAWRRDQAGTFQVPGETELKPIRELTLKAAGEKNSMIAAAPSSTPLPKRENEEDFFLTSRREKLSPPPPLQKKQKPKKTLSI